MVMVFPAKETGAEVGLAVGDGADGCGDAGVAPGVTLGAQANRSTRTRQIELSNTNTLFFSIFTPLKLLLSEKSINLLR